MNHENTPDPIEMAVQAAPMDRAPSEATLRKLRLAAHKTRPRAAWWRSGKALPFAVVLAAGAAVMVTMLPAKASAKTFDLVVAAAQRINAFQFSIVSDESPKKEAFTIAGSDGHVYMRGDGTGLMEIDATALSVYDPKENKVMRLKFGGLMDAQTAAQMAGAVQSGIAEGMKEMDLKKMLDEYRKKYGSEGVRVSPQSVENGHLVYHVTLSSPKEPERVEMTVNDATDLPETIQVTQDGRSRVRMEMRFGDGVDAALLHSPIPAGAKVEEIDLGTMVGDAMKGVGKGLEGLGDQIKAGTKKGP